MSDEIFYYLCHKCAEHKELCKLVITQAHSFVVGTKPGIPTECPFLISFGFTAEWEQVDKKEFDGN